MSFQTLIQISNSENIGINKKEVLRYLGACEVSEEINEMIEEIAPDVYRSVGFKAVYITVDLKIDGDLVDMGFTCVKSRALAKNLTGCKNAFVFAATLGLENDRAIERNFKLDTARASIYNCISTALIESFCDYVNDYLGKDKKLRPRFSPGYGDFSITHQKDVINALDANRKIGITLTDSYMMKPSKSVTAVIGIERE